jgi:DNA-binding IclR family transcriptional regulator
VSSSLAKVLGIMDLFQDRRTCVQQEELVELLGISRATAYRYLRALCHSGLLSQTSGGRYVLGPRIIELDRHMRRSDPLLTAGRAVMHETAARLGLNMILASFFRDRAMCVDIAWPDTSIAQNYERGKPMTLFRGALAKMILAYLSPYQLRNVALNHADEIKAAGIGDDWKSFRDQMAQLRKEGFCITRAEIVPESVGVGAPILDGEGRILGSITFAIPTAKFDAGDANLFAQSIKSIAAQISARIAEGAAPGADSLSGKSEDKPKPKSKSKSNAKAGSNAKAKANAEAKPVKAAKATQTAKVSARTAARKKAVA